MKRWPRVIVHVDMDAFFASVEQLLHPEWRGKPVVVGADPKQGKGRGVVAAASYEARRYGIHSAMPISQAYRKCPQAIFVPPHGKLYETYSRRIMQVLEQITPRIEPISIDEAFLDATGIQHFYPDMATLGRRIKERIFQETSLTASVGIASSKSVAKIASDIQKPDGLTIVPPEQVQPFLDPLPVSKLWGVGPRTRQRLEEMGIRTVSRLRQMPRAVLEKKLGRWGTVLWHLARGEDERPVQTDETIKSISHEHTFEQDQQDPDVLQTTLLELCEKVARRLRKGQLRGRTVQLKIRLADFKTFTRHKTLSFSIQLTEDIFQVGSSLLAAFLPPGEPVRLLGIGISHLEPEQGTQMSIWDLQNERKHRLEQAIDELEEKFGRSIIVHAQTLAGKKPSRSS